MLDGVFLSTLELIVIEELLDQALVREAWRQRNGVRRGEFLSSTEFCSTVVDDPANSLAMVKRRMSEGMRCNPFQ